MIRRIPIRRVQEAIKSLDNLPDAHEYHGERFELVLERFDEVHRLRQKNVAWNEILKSVFSARERPGLRTLMRYYEYLCVRKGVRYGRRPRT